MNESWREKRRLPTEGLDTNSIYVYMYVYELLFRYFHR